MKLKESENFVILGIFLGAVGLLSALVLALVSGLTAPAIAKAERKAQSKALAQLNFGKFDNDPAQETCTSDGVTFMAVRNGKQLVGIAAEAVTDRGYAGNVKELVGFKSDGTITAVLITEEKETPGLGKVVCERKAKKTIFNFWKPAPEGLPENKYLDQFNQRNAGDAAIKWQVKKDGGDFDFKTGATVTSRAVVEMTGHTAQTFAKHRAEILKKFGETPEVTK